MKGASSSYSAQGCFYMKALLNLACLIEIEIKTHRLHGKNEFKFSILRHLS